MCVCAHLVCVFVYVQVHVHVCGGQRITLGVACWERSPWYFEAGSLIRTWGSLIRLGLSGQQAPGNNLCLLPQTGNYKCMLPCLVLVSSSGPHAYRVGQAPSGCGRLSSLPSPLPPVILGQCEYETCLGKPQCRAGWVPITPDQ